MINEGDNDNYDTEVSSICSDFFATVVHDIHELILFNDTNSQESSNSCSKGPIPGTWLLLYSQATIDVISNGELLTNIHHVKTTLHIRCMRGLKQQLCVGTYQDTDRFVTSLMGSLIFCH